MLNRFLTVDDDPRAHVHIADWIGNLFANSEAVAATDRIASAEDLIERVKRDHFDGVVVDYKLRAANYCPVDGLELVSALFDAGIPAVLASSYPLSDIQEYVWYGGKAPAVVQKGHLEQHLRDAFQLSILRLRGKHTAQTKPYPALVRVLSVDDREVGLIIPAFDPDEGLLVDREKLVERLPGVELVKDLRFIADTNIGAASREQIYLENLRATTPLSEEYARLLHT